MNIESTAEIKADESLVMIVYGKGGVGKTTFAATAPGVLILDFENGSKYLGQRGIKAAVVRLSAWLTEQDKHELRTEIKKYQTIVVDPLGEAMEKLMDSSSLNGPKYRQPDGSLTMAGWGEAKKKMRAFIKWLRDTGKNVIIIAHDSEEKDGEQIVHRIQVATKLREELPTIVDVISYMGVRMVNGRPVRMLYTPRQGEAWESKDRTGRVPLAVEVSEKSGFEDFLASLAPIKSPPVAGHPQRQIPPDRRTATPPPKHSTPDQNPSPQGRNDWAKYWERAAGGIVNEQYRTSLIERLWEAVERNDPAAAKDAENEIIHALQEAV